MGAAVEWLTMCVIVVMSAQIGVMMRMIRSGSSTRIGHSRSRGGGGGGRKRRGGGVHNVEFGGHVRGHSNLEVQYVEWGLVMVVVVHGTHVLTCLHVGLVYSLSVCVKVQACAGCALIKGRH